MANQVKTVFSVDTGAAIRAIDAYEKRLRLVTDLESKIGTKTASGGSRASGGGDPAMKAAMADIAKMQRERDRMEREATKAVEREAKAQARIREREAKRSADAMIAELKRIERENQKGQSFGPGGGFLGQIADQMGISPMAAASFTAAGAAIAGLSVGVSKVVDVYTQAIDRTIQAEKANRLLASSAVEAGQSYTFLAKQNEEFAKSVGLSQREAATTTASIARLASNAGLKTEQDISRLSKAFADLGAARGINGGDLQNLIGTILSGQDEGLNRLGIADPGALQKAYAEQIGKTADQLTQYEKTQAAVNAVLEKAGLYTGAAEQRMAGFEGSVVKATAAWNDFSDAVSKGLVDNPTMKTLLGIGTGTLGGAKPPTDQLKAIIQSGGTPTFTDKLKASNMQPLEAITLGLTNFISPLLTNGLMLYNNPISRYRGVDSQVSSETSLKQYQDGLAKGQIALDEAKRANEESEALAESQRKSMEEAAKAEQERIAKLKEALRSVRDIITGIEGQRNPFVSIFEAGYQSLLKVSELAKQVGGDLSRMAMNSVQRQITRQLDDARVSSALQSFNLSSSAADFRSGINLDALTPGQAERRRMSQLYGQLNAIGAYRPTLMTADPTKAERRRYEAELAAWEARRPSIDKQVIDLTQGMNPSRLDSQTRELAASARERESARVADQEREARALFKSLSGIIGQDGIRVVLGSGEQVVRIVNEAPGSATVTRPNGNSVGNRYGN